MKHTPGPWCLEAEKVITNPKAETGRWLVKAKGPKPQVPVAVVGSMVEDWHEEEEANARLIAAAPTLLKELNQAAAALAVIANQEAHPGLADHTLLVSVRGFALEAFRQARAAAIKAEES